MDDIRTQAASIAKVRFADSTCLSVSRWMDGRMGHALHTYIIIGSVYVQDKVRVALSWEFAVERLVVPGMMI
jgi:hypothetical protein